MRMGGEESRSYWQQQSDKLRASGLSRSEYCRRNNLSVSRMAYWEGRLTDLKARSKLKASRFAKAIVAPSHVGDVRGVIRLVVGSDLVIECGSDIEPTWIVRLAAALKAGS